MSNDYDVVILGAGAGRPFGRALLNARDAQHADD